MWWQWLIFGLIILAVPYGLYEIKKFATKRIKPTEEQNKIANQRFAILCLFYWLCDCFYMTFIINNLVWKFILGGLIMVIIFYNLSKAFINGNSLLKFVIVQDFIVGIALTIYLIYIIPNESLQQIIIPIIAAVYGGLLTLVGVAWTIKKSDRDRKEEEIKKAKPIFSYNILFEESSFSVNRVCTVKDKDIERFNDIRFEICNSPNSVLYISRLFHDSKWFNLIGNKMILPNSVLPITFSFTSEDNIILEVKDYLSNIYYYKLNVVALNKTTKNAHFEYAISGIDEITTDYIKKLEEKIKEEEKK